MLNIYEETLNILLNSLELAFTNCGLDRKSLHMSEWQTKEGSPSVLGEIEVRADAVIGISKSFLKKHPKNIKELIDILEIGSIYQSELLVGWVATNGKNYQEFLGYLAAIENLRMGTISFLKKSII